MSEQQEIDPSYYDEDEFHNEPPQVEEEPVDCIDFNLLRLDSFNSTAANRHRTPCRNCSGAGSFPLAATISSSSNKRRSSALTAPTAMVSSGQPTKKPKKLFEDPPENPAMPFPSGVGFSKIDLPINLSAGGSGARSENHTRFNTQTQSSNSIPFLRRCDSDPYNPFPAGSGSVSAGNVDPQSPPESNKIAAVTMPASKGSASLPPLPPSLRRSLSDPSPSKSFSRSSSFSDIAADESPNYETWKKMKSYMKEMNNWMLEILPDQEICENDVDKETEEVPNTLAKKEMLKKLSVLRELRKALSFTSSVPVGEPIRYFSLEIAVTTSSCRDLEKVANCPKFLFPSATLLQP